MMREQTRKTPHPEFIEQINGRKADISGLGAANYNYCPAILLCANSNFLHQAAAGEDAGTMFCGFWTSIVHVILQRSYVA